MTDQKEIIDGESRDFEHRIVTIMHTLDIDYYTIFTYIGSDNALFDVLRVHFKGDDTLHTANEFEQPTFGLLKELEMLVMGETS